MPYKIFSDSSCDLPEQFIEDYDITTIPFYVSFDQEHYYKEIVELSITDFYKKLTQDRIFPKTSLPSVDDYMAPFKSAIEAGFDVLCICLTQHFSGSYQSAMTAKDILEEEYPDANICVINSILAAGAQGLFVMQAAKMQKSGYSIEDTVEVLERLKHTGRVFFTVGTLEFLQKGGRIGKAAALAGQLLNLKPVIQLEGGELIPVSKVRGRKKSLEQTLTMVKEYFDTIDAQYYQYDFCVITGTHYEEANTFKDSLSQMIDLPINNPIFTIGTTIGTNTGPDVIGACFIRRFDA